MELTDAERKLVHKFLRDLIERMGNAGCNDFEMEDTPENREILQAAYTCEPEHEPFNIEQYARNGKLLCFDWIIVAYLARKFKSA